MSSMILKPGDRVAIVGLSSIFKWSVLKPAMKELERWGLKPLLAPRLQKKNLIFSGTVEDRAAQIQWAVRNPKVKAIWCVRGGYGAYDLIPFLKKMKRPAHPKVLIGYSDVTAVHLFFNQTWKWPSLHGPLFNRLADARAAKNQKSLEMTKAILMNREYRLSISKGLSSQNLNRSVVGTLVGGNLAMMAASLGTDWEIQTNGKVLFIEEIGERAGRLDRLLAQLEQAGKFDQVKALILGDFVDCREADGKDYTKEILEKRFAKHKIPIVRGFPAGHGRVNLPFVLGRKIRIEGGKEFCLVESIQGLG
ncbi:MAG: LD-carboxypeptidase [Oligoflexia bacterium]|nr:LD-carboxypeptidase [Oligoflexia bacterium]